MWERAVQMQMPKKDNSQEIKLEPPKKKELTPDQQKKKGICAQLLHGPPRRMPGTNKEMATRTPRNREQGRKRLLPPEFQTAQQNSLR